MPKFLHFRSNTELESLLEEEIAALRARDVPENLSNRSAVARMILMTHLQVRQDERLRGVEGRELTEVELQTGMTKATARELLTVVSGATETAVKRAVADALGRVPEYLEDAILAAVQETAAEG